MAGGSVKGKLDMGNVALDVLIARVTEALMQQSHDFIQCGIMGQERSYFASQYKQQKDAEISFNKK